jgi:(heptosyl)LPS beta-1,4-glucosyltransferase
MPSISAVIITLNEEANIARCLNSLKDVVDEIVVLDSFSSDKTVEICESLNAKVVQQVWKGYAASKNYANSLAKGSYILSIDADEVLSESLKKSILKVKPALTGAYSFNRLNFYRHIPVRYCGWYPDKKVRLFPKDAAEWQGDFVHEQLVLKKGTPTIHLKGDLHHYTINSTADHKKTVEKYARLAAAEMKKKGQKVFFLKPYLAYAAMFLKKYFLQLGILEGTNGVYISHYSALSRYMKYEYLLQG